MKHRFWAMAAVALLTAVTAWVIFFVISFKDRVQEYSGLLDASALDRAQPAFGMLLLVVFLQVAISFLAVIAAVAYYTRKLNSREMLVVETCVKTDTLETVDAQAVETVALNWSGDSRQALLEYVCNQTQAVQAAIYDADAAVRGEVPVYHLTQSFALFLTEERQTSFPLGQGIVGQVASTRHAVLLTDLPAGYLKVVSGLGERHPSCLLVEAAPANHAGIAPLVAEFAFFKEPDAGSRSLISQALPLLAQMQPAEIHP